MVLDLVAEEDQGLAHDWLFRCEDGSPFAYARGHDFIRYRDQTLWARLCDDQLLSMRSGNCLAYRLGSVFYDAVSQEAVYYEPSSLALPAPPRGERSAVRAMHVARPHPTARSSSHAHG